MARPFFLFAHGAGAPASSPWMRAWAERLGALGDVTPFDYPYMRAGRKVPDRPDALIAAHKEALAGVRARAGTSATAAPIFLAGKSMGSRIGCHVALEEPVAGLVCLGYPLVAGGSGAVRDDVLVALRTRILFVQGTRDPLCPLPRLEEVRARMTAPNELHVVEGGNHSLEVSGGKKKNAAGQAESDASVLESIRRFVAGVAAAAVAALILLVAGAAHGKPLREVARIAVPEGIISEGFALDERGARLAYIVTDAKAGTRLLVAATASGAPAARPSDLSRFASAPERVVSVGAGWFVIANEGRRRAAAIPPGGGGLVRQIGPFTDAFVSTAGGKGGPAFVTVADRGERAGGHDYDIAAFRAGGAPVGRKAVTIAADGTIAGSPGLVFQAFAGGYLQALVKKPGRYDARADARSPGEIATYDLLGGKLSGAHRVADFARFADLVVKRNEKPGLEVFVRLDDANTGLELVGPAEKLRPLAFPAKLDTYDVGSLAEQHNGARLYLGLVTAPGGADPEARKRVRALHVFDVDPATARATAIGEIPLGEDRGAFAWVAGGDKVAFMRKTRGDGGNEIVIYGR